ncbi:MAG: cation-translocating P-type ATPase [Spiroplasma sp.]|nr:cation-translocating P-type ATPase [Spiroplasma sp.]
MFWKDDINKVALDLNTDLEKGLTANQAANTLKKDGFNQLPTTKQKSVFKMILEYIIEPFNLVLLVLLVIAAVLGRYAEVVVIVLIVIVEIFLGVYQEKKAANSLDSLKKLVKNHAVVIREGKKFTVDAKELVVGDLLYLEAGMFLPADVRIIQSFNLRINESILTGESNLVIKTIAPLNNDSLGIGDRTNMGFMSTMVATGSGLAIVVATGKNTEIGKITKLLQEEKEKKSPLSKQITWLITIICILAILLGVIIFCIQYFVNKEYWAESLIFAVALAIAIIPEGLNVIVTVSLSLGSRRMAKKNAIVKRLNAVETLGQVNVICSDKTGTLTENRMTVQKYWLHDEVQDAVNFDQETQQEKLFIQSLVLDNNSSVADQKITGDPTEAALLKWAEDLKINSRQIQKKYRRIHELPFDSDRKLMSTINNYDGQKYLFIKGAPDKLIKVCTHILIDNKKIKLTKELKSTITRKIATLSDQALRVLGAGYRVIIKEHDFNDVAYMERSLIFLGLVGMIDPPRKEVKSALITTQGAGITTKMITGDHLNTAVAIGKELNLLKNKDQAISGEKIERLTDKKLQQSIHKYQVFARVSPEHKVRIIKALQAHKDIVSMTGDGVNDAPSLKAANIGVAMGITGTDVAKEAAQVVLTDDNFSTIVDAIEEGRNIYNKLKRIICFIIITNLSQVLAIIIASLLRWGNLLTPLQILWINLIVESVLSITMSMGPNSPKLMRQKPINGRESILKGSWKFIIFVGVILAALLLVSFKFLPEQLGYANDHGFIYAFIIMVNAPVFYSIAFSLGRHETIFTSKIFENRAFYVSVLISFVLNVLIIFVPGLNDVFGVKIQVSFVEWIICIAIAVIPTACLEVFKFFLKGLKKLQGKQGKKSHKVIDKILEKTGD